jgi:hypothetical protein
MVFVLLECVRKNENVIDVYETEIKSLQDVVHEPLECLQETGGPGVVRMWWTVLCCTSRWTPVGRMRSGNSERMLSTGVLALMSLILGTRELAAWADADKDVTPSSTRLRLQSTKSP